MYTEADRQKLGPLCPDHWPADLVLLRCRCMTLSKSTMPTNLQDYYCTGAPSSKGVCCC